MHRFTPDIGIIIFALSICFSSSTANANLLSPFSNDNSEVTWERLVNEREPYECNSESDHERYCVDDFRYYHLSTLLELGLTEEGGVNSVAMSLPLSASHYSQALLNLRKDGWYLVRFHVSNETLDIQEQLAVRSVSDVDDSVFRLMNAYPLTEPREAHFASSLSENRHPPLSDHQYFKEVIVRTTHRLIVIEFKFD